MVVSMTGFGRGVVNSDGRMLTLEIKSVNHRFLDLNIRLPRVIQFAEEAIRNAIASRCARGHFDVTANYRNMRTDAREVTVDAALLQAYLRAQDAIKADAPVVQGTLTINDVMRLPDVLNITEAAEDRDAVSMLAEEAAGIALKELCAMRAAEGTKLEADILARMDTLLALVSDIEAHADEALIEYHQKLRERVAELLAEVPLDETRLIQEVAFYADRTNITEELVRLKSHAQQFADALHGGEPAGRRLDFIVQEMNRECNTIASKAQNTRMQHSILSCKGEIEKLREQIQNIE